MARSLLLKIVGASCAVAGLASPTAAIAASPAGFSPLVSLSMVASPQSQAALCGTVAATATTTAVNSQSQPVQGCILPVPDAAAAPLPPQAAAARTGFSPLLIGLGAIGLGVLLFALLHDDESEPPPQPVSPA